MKFIITSTRGRKYDCVVSHTEEITSEIVRGVVLAGEQEVIEINTLKELMNLVDKLREIDSSLDGIIINRWWRSNNYWELEIYDGYRE